MKSQHEMAHNYEIESAMWEGQVEHVLMILKGDQS